MSRTAKLLLTPIVLWLLMFMLLPFSAVVLASFLTRNPYGGVLLSFDLSNYVRFFDSLYLSIYVETLSVSFLTTILCLILSYPLAYYIASLHPSRQKYWLILVTLPFWINFLIRTYAWVLLLQSQGVVNSLLLDLGLISQPLQLLYTKGAVLLGMVYTFIPFMVLPIYVALDKLDHRLLEAAYDLGASKRQAFMHITWPQTKAGVMTGSILVFISTMGMFVVTDILGGAKSMLISNIIQNQFLGARDWPFGSVLSVVFVLSSLILVGLFQWALRTRRREQGRER